MTKGKVIYLTGYSGAGKTTLAKQLQKLIPFSILLDGDEIRGTINKDLGFNREAKIENIRRNNATIELLANQGLTVICAFMASIAEERDKLFRNDFDIIKVQLITPLHICAERDIKGLYEKSPADFAGVSAKYNELSDPCIKLDTNELTIAACVTIIMEEFYGRQIQINTRKEK